jgi:hypothetical protein
MRKLDDTWKIFISYILIIFLVLVSNIACGQVIVTEFNAGWNSANNVEWLDKLNDCEVAKIDIVNDPKLQTKHKVVIVPTIIIFNDGEEVKRFQADISFKMLATREEVQDTVDELLMSDF